MVLIDNNTPGYYNESLGTVLDGTSEAFPIGNDLALDFPEQPNLSVAQPQLAGWLQSPPQFLSGTWSGIPIQIPREWSGSSETAIVYKINVPAKGYSNLLMSFGVDNGVFVWLDGKYLGGHLRGGGSSLGEHQFSVNYLAAGTHYIQVLREDHGAPTGYDIRVTTDTNAVTSIDAVQISPTRAKQGEYINISAQISGNQSKIGEVVFMLGGSQLATLTDPDKDGTWSAEYQLIENFGYHGGTRIYAKSSTGAVIARWPGFTVSK